MLEGPIDLDTYAEITSGSVAARPEQPGDRPLIVADTSAAVRDQILSLCSGISWKISPSRRSIVSWINGF